MNLNIRKMGIGFTNKTETTQKAAIYTPTGEQKVSGANLTGEPQKDTIVITSKSAQETAETKAPVVETAKKEEPAKILTKEEEEKKLLKKLRKKAQKGKLKPPTEEEIKIIMTMPIDDHIKNDLRGLLKNTEICNDPAKYNKGVLEILDKHKAA